MICRTGFGEASWCDREKSIESGCVSFCGSDAIRSIRFDDCRGVIGPHSVIESSEAEGDSKGGGEENIWTS